jgi:hypothetical protein
MTRNLQPCQIIMYDGEGSVRANCNFLSSFKIPICFPQGGPLYFFEHLSLGILLKMLYPLSILSLLLLVLIHLTHGHNQQYNHPVSYTQKLMAEDTIPFETRAYWMRRANAALAELASPCPFAPFGSVVVNHSDTSSDPKGKLVCISVNQNMQKGNPTLHGMQYRH